MHSVFQPLVDLDTESIVGYEALARGPQGPLATPDSLFAAARRSGRLQELDELCRHSAITGATAAGINAPLTLFVNVEPEALDLESLAKLLPLTDTTGRGPQLVLEITERALAFQPAELFRAVQRLREAGWRIALDDVGADDLSLAFMPLLRPDVIKLDMQLVQSRPDAAIAQIMNAVNAYAEQSGCLLLAEGIETRQHLAIARSVGAQVGQGWLFGRPTGTVSLDQGGTLLPLPEPAPTTTHPSPFSYLPAAARLRESTKPLLVQVSKHLERQAERLGSSCLLLSTFQQGHHFGHATADRYRKLAGTVGFVGALGAGVTPDPGSRVRGADLPPGDPILQEWDVIVLAPHFAGALLARDLHTEEVDDRERTFAFALTYDRDVVEHAARTLMSRIQPTR
ncbi:EAL domain-containing protein (putative c-di-GMP-specific phosphodiesterase class I) [Nakamurella sp. UYEF19]